MKKGRILPESKVLGNIPDEVLYDIFIKLSIKDILRCRSVSKSWSSLLSDPRFVYYHDNAKRMDNFGSQRHVCISRKSIKSTSYRTLKCKDLSLPFVDTKNENLPEFLCSYEGLVLVGSGDKDHFLWNPYTGSYKQIPCDFSHSRDYCKLYGLGYDNLTDAYKVVRLVCNPEPKPPKSGLLRFRPNVAPIEFPYGFYNCKTKCWKRISDFPYIFRSVQGIVLNGAPHWIVARADNKKEYVIIYFDVVADIIREFETPLPCSLGGDFKFSNFQESLCLVTTAKSSSQVWVLQEDGAIKTWNQLFKMDKEMNPQRGYLGYWFNVHVHDFVPLCYRNEETLIEVRSKNINSDIIDEKGNEKLITFRPLRLLTYNHDTKAQRVILKIQQHKRDYVFNSITYMERLFSPKSVLS